MCLRGFGKYTKKNRASERKRRACARQMKRRINRNHVPLLWLPRGTKCQAPRTQAQAVSILDECVPPFFALWLKASFRALDHDRSYGDV